MINKDILEKNKQRFLKLCRDEIKRDGIDKLLDYIENKSDFFTAPASTKFHGNFEGGLCQHSLNVLDMLISSEQLNDVSKESIVLCALFHDICKTNYYKKGTKSIKNDQGQWKESFYYYVDDKLCMGHGEGSVYILNSYIKLSRDEALAISWHMGGFDERVKGGSSVLSNVFTKCHLALELHIADMRATYETEYKNKREGE